MQHQTKKVIHEYEIPLDGDNVMQVSVTENQFTITYGQDECVDPAELAATIWFLQQVKASELFPWFSEMIAAHAQLHPMETVGAIRNYKLLHWAQLFVAME
jgi:hypothetical protein